MYLLVGAPPLFLHNAMAVTIQKPDKVGTHTHTQCSAFESPIPAASGSYRSFQHCSENECLSLRKQVTMRQSQGQQPFSWHSSHRGRQIHLLVRVQTSAKFGWHPHPSILIPSYWSTSSIEGIKLVLLFVAGEKPDPSDSHRPCD